MMETALKNKKKLIENRGKFLETFGVGMERFFHPFFGFDVVRFDEWLKTPDGKSTREFLVEKYDVKAMELVESII